MSFKQLLVLQKVDLKINIMGASKYGEFVFLLPELSQIIFSPGPLIFKLRKL
jgi:hypothetical protein